MSQENLAKQFGEKYGKLDKQENLFDPEGAYKLGVNQFIFRNFGTLGYKIDSSFIHYKNFFDEYLNENFKSLAAKKYKVPLYEPIIIDHFMYLYFMHKDRSPNKIYAYYNAFLFENLQKLNYLNQFKMITQKGRQLIDNINMCGFNGFNMKCLSDNYRFFSEIVVFLEKTALPTT